MKLILVLFLVSLAYLPSSAQANGKGKFLNPITDICWSCVFPIHIAGKEVVKGKQKSPKGCTSAICTCRTPPAGIPMIGLPLAFHEPARLIEIVRQPYKLLLMGGITVANSGIYGRGDVEENTSDATHHSFYHVHYYIYPILYWLEVLMDFICLDNASIDLAYLTELDVMWIDDAKAFILNPEAALFGSLAAQTACVADGIAASTSLPINQLWWCNGAQGSMLPYTGNVNEHSGGVQASLLIAGRFLAKLHRELLAWGTYGTKGLCDKYPMPIIKKQQYRFQMVYPIPYTQNCFPLGATEVFWGSGKEFPYNGSDFAYLIWRKRDCCLRPIPAKAKGKKPS